MSSPRAESAARVSSRPPAGHVLLCLPWLALLAYLVEVAWFLTDDAFIGFRYARNLLEGHGLVFNPGERVEGYSNFLWVLELAALWGLFGLRPEHVAPWLSVAYTAGTVAVVLWWVARSPALLHRGLTGWMALGLLCSSATFAVWTSGGGLETRQFTFFIVLAVVCLGVHGNSRRGLLVASLSLAAAAYTRPEGPLLAACCFGWFAVQRLAAAKRLRLDWRDVVFLVAPFAILVAAHFLFRYAYYGEWLPNTYYAKHVLPWYESGFRYLCAAALETGLYLLIPLAWIALRRQWRLYRDGTYALVLLLIGVHMAYVMRIGGDHFEYRPLDFYWPLLALPAAEGIAYAGSQAALVWRRTLPSSLWLGTRACALILFVPVIFYSGAVQATLLFEGAAIREWRLKLHIDINEENAGWLLGEPGMPALAAISNDLRRLAAAQSVASRFTEHREFANMQLRKWKPYEHMERGVIPDDALMAGGGLGIRFYYLPDLKVIDIFGLTDTTLARNPVTMPNRERVMAHDRHPPPGYLEKRGVNIIIHPAAPSEAEALDLGGYAVKVGPGLWMPFDSGDHRWVAASFDGRDLRFRAAELIRSRQPEIRSVFDVYLVGNTLIYAKKPCEQDDVAAKFFLHLDPVDVNDLSDHRKQYGFDNLDFNFDRHGVRIGGTCLATVPLPKYAIASIRTGQYIPGEGGVWEGSFDLAGQADDRKVVIHHGNHRYLRDQVLAHFEDGSDVWHLEGDAMTNRNQHERYKGQQPISGNAGEGFLTSYHPDKGDRTTGRAVSPEFTAESGQYLFFLIAGERGDGVGVRLLADGEEVVVWRGKNTEHFDPVVHPLAEVAGQRLQLELFDDETGGWGHVMLDHVMLVRRFAP